MLKKQLIDNLFGPPKTISDKKLEDFKLQNVPKPEKPRTLIEESFENISISEQYEKQIETLKAVGLIEHLASGEYSIIGQDKKEYIVPTLEEILERMNKDIEKYKTKIEQGFSKLLIVPFAKKLYDPEDDKSLTSAYSKLILEKHQNNQLMATSGDALELDGNTPLWVWEDGYNQDDENIIYFPKQYDPENHGGKTKNQLLQEENLGFQILLIEDLPDLPAENEGKTIVSRPQLEANLTPIEYLEKLQTDPNYQHEQGLTAEAWLTYTITYLYENDQVIDDWKGQGKFCYNLATYFPSSTVVSSGSWRRNFRQSSLGRNDVSNRFSVSSARPSVNI